jgi:cytochrome c
MKIQIVVLALLALTGCSKAPEQSDATTPATQTETAAVGGAPASFGQCAICHQVKPGVNGLGPSMHGIVGRKAGTVAGFAYSPAMKNSGLTWDEASLNAFIEAPQKLVPGTRMSFAGVKDKGKRDEIVAWLKSNSQ